MLIPWSNYTNTVLLKQVKLLWWTGAAEPALSIQFHSSELRGSCTPVKQTWSNYIIAPC